ncbi:kinesin-like protein KIF14 isoform X2 [Pseudophryne corroboree]|uniref:kinesin-like protein KIF14 isoform X2 n=1 Tax=Pseudophryne corroboree TaxID=495146 RepID=UPI0030812AF2
MDKILQHTSSCMLQGINHRWIINVSRGRNSHSRHTSGFLIGKVSTAKGFILQLLTDLHEISTSSNDVEIYEQQELGDVGIQHHILSISSAFKHMAVSVQQLHISQSSYLTHQLVGEVKKLGSSVTFLLHGCECDITSMLKKSKKQINQSIAVIAGFLGQISITRQPNFIQPLEEQCGLEQAEMQFQSSKNQNPNYSQDLSLHELYKRFACHLSSIVLAWKDITAKSIQYMTDGAMDFVTMKQDVERFFNSTSLSAKAFSSLCSETAGHHCGCNL